jgi:D-glycero-alpha-D-manno-heptose-7-phosphate kinase
MLPFIPIRAHADVILKQQSAQTSDKMPILWQMKDLANARQAFSGRGDLEEFGRLLHDGWELRRSLGFGISDGRIDGGRNRPARPGAQGGKLLSAGGGGFLPVMARVSGTKPSAKHRHPRGWIFRWTIGKSNCLSG